MRIVHVAPSYFPAVRYGGPIWSVHGLARAQAQAGHEVEVLTTSMDGDDDLDVVPGAPVDRDGVRVRYFPVARAPRALSRRLFHAPMLGQALPDAVRSAQIVHCHSVFLSPTTQAARAARARGVPHVLSPRGMLWPEMIRRRSALPKRLWLALFERANVERASLVHVTASLEAERLRALGLRPRRMVEIPNGVDMEPRASAAGTATALDEDVRRATARPGYVLSFGRISWKKNNGALIEGLSRLDALHAVIAGNDEEGEAARLRTLVDRHGLADRVTVLDRQIGGADKTALFAHAGLFALASHSENFGNTVLEAMVHGLPVLCSDAVGAAQVVREARCGTVCAPDAPGVADALRALTQDPDRARTMGRAGQAHARARYGWGPIAQRMVEAYRELAP